MKNNPVTPFAALLASLALGILPVAAELLVYEPFNYGPAEDGTRAGNALLDGQPDFSEGDGDVDATGLGGSWGDSTDVTSDSDLFMASGSLLLGDLVISGNHVRGDTNLNNDIFSRPITTSLDGGSELWFSFLANKLQNNFNAAQGGIVIGNQAVNNSRVLNDTGSTGLAGFGVAPTSAGNNWTAYAWNGTSQSVGDASFGVPTNGSQVNLLVGKVSFNTGTGGTDEFTLYYYDLDGGSTIAGGFLVQIGSTIEVDVDESTLDTLSLTRQVNTAYDEIRIGTTQADVTPGGGGPGPVDNFLISAISSPQIVGEPITGITLTARDASNNTAIGFTGTVTFGGTGGFSGTSDSFTAGVLSGVSVTPTVAGTDLTLTVDDGAGHTGSVTIATIESPATDDYATWSGGAAADGDANGDGVANAVAWAIGAEDPHANAIGLLPTLDISDPDDFIVTFNRSDAAEADATTTITVEYGSDLSSWTTATDGVAGVTIDDSVVPAEGLRTVVVTIPKTLAVGGKLFARLNVVIAP